MITCTVRYEIGLRPYEHAKRTKCIRRYDRSFTKPLFEGATVEELGL